MHRRGVKARVGVPLPPSNTANPASEVIRACLHGPAHVALQYASNASAKDAMEVYDKDGWSAFHAAAAQDKASVVKVILEKPGRVSVDVKAPDAGPRAGETAMMAAAASGSIMTALLLHDYEADLNAKDKKGNTPLLKAAEFCRQPALLRVALWLCADELGCDVAAANSAGATALHHAVRSGSGGGRFEALATAILKRLQGQDRAAQQRCLRQCPNEAAGTGAGEGHGLPPLCLAAGNGMLETCTMMLAMDPELLTTRAADGSTPLMHAARNGRVDVMTFLRENGAAVDCKSAASETLMMAAVQGGQAAVDWVSVNAEFNLEDRDDDGDTALMKALAGKHGPVAVGLITGMGADVTAKNCRGETALMLAAQSGHQEAAMMLVERGADVNAQARNGDTALLRAVTHSQEAVAVFLLVMGAALLPDKTTVLNLCQERRLDNLMLEIGRLDVVATHPVRVVAERSSSSSPAPNGAPAPPSAPEESVPPSGVSGASGGSGPRGASGASGPRGASGASVPRGASGASRPRGARSLVEVSSGASGASGPRRGSKPLVGRQGPPPSSSTPRPHNSPPPSPPLPSAQELAPPAPPARPDSAPQLPSTFPRESTREDEKQDEPCVICLDAPRGCILYPCAHLCCCVECANVVEQCPICRTKIEYRAKNTKVYNV
eukprot:TRINITY_DN3877_c1_g1_i1.p1 TRINITY_DN3877_c1_g1~~TRINITY_DN3877_c1_g1_i1.p1  ORF type:complete len:665 (+),score=65.73 TRINITY_DN3877_c1_g1_i1:36-2030(+)